MRTFGSQNISVYETIPDDWDEGFVANFDLTVGSGLNGWTFVFDFAGDIANIWNARIISHEGDRYVIEPQDYAANAAPGETLSWGFQGIGSAQDIIPVSVNGEALESAETSEPDPQDAPNDTSTADTAGPNDGSDPVADTPQPVLETINSAAAPQATPDGGSSIADGPLSTKGNQIIDANGDAVQIRAVNWFGAEGDLFAPHGLWQRGMTEMMDQMAEEGFNAIRLPFSVEGVLTNPVVNGVDGDASLSGLRMLKVFDKIIDYADQTGMKIILDSHRVESGAGADGIWYTDTYSEDDWINAWQTLAERYSDKPSVIGADLHNEPHYGTWGGGGDNDWAAAAERAGNAVLDIADNWLILVEGVGSHEGDSYWWGGQLAGVRDRPIELDVDNKLVYSPHDYPASIFEQSWFTDGSDLYEVFREHWGFIQEEGIAPILLGEFGSRLENPLDQTWADAITTYLSGDYNSDGTSDLSDGEFGPSFAWWSWNPNSGDTGGILEDDWMTVRQDAADLLAPLLSTPATQSEVPTDSDPADPDLGDPVPVDPDPIDPIPVEPDPVDPDSMDPGHGDHDGHDHSGDQGTDGGHDNGDHGGGMDTGPYTDITEFGSLHGTSSHTHQDSLEGGRTVITTEAFDSYNGLRAFLGLEQVGLEDVGEWAYANQLTNNPEPYGETLKGVGLYYGMQGAKVGWIADDKFDPQLLADIQREARLGTEENVMDMVEQAGHLGFAQYLVDADLVDTFVNTLKMEPHYGGWMHGAVHGPLPFDTEDGASIPQASAHDLNHLTVLSHDQTRPFMNDTFDYPQWPALDTPTQDVIDYFQSMVTLDDPKGDALPVGTTGTDNPDPVDPIPIDPDPVDPAPVDPDPVDPDPVDPEPNDPAETALDVRLIVSDDWGSGAVVSLEITNPDPDTTVSGWDISFNFEPSILNTWNGITSDNADTGTITVSNETWNADIPPSQTVTVGFQVDQGNLDEEALNAAAEFYLVDGGVDQGDQDHGGDNQDHGGAGGTGTPDPDQPGGGPQDQAPGNAEDGSDALDARLTVLNDWGSGATIELEVTNVDNLDLQGGWSVGLNVDADVTNIWNGSYEDNPDTNGITISGADWIADINQGQTVKVGFQVDKGGLDQDELNEDADFFFML